MIDFATAFFIICLGLSAVLFTGGFFVFYALKGVAAFFTADEDKQ